jgi:hypothetical protein
LMAAACAVCFGAPAVVGSRRCAEQIDRAAVRAARILRPRQP